MDARLLPVPIGDGSELAWVRALELLAERVARLEQRLAVEKASVGPPLSNPLQRMTDTERRIAELVAKGCTYEEVASRLSFSPKTVEWNLSKIYRKAYVRSRTELAAKLARTLVVAGG
jgi:DNA-binding CsgD family transcriptional regulator